MGNNRDFYKLLCNKINEHDTSINKHATKQVKLYIEPKNIKILDMLSQYFGISKSLLINDIIELV